MLLRHLALTVALTACKSSGTDSASHQGSAAIAPTIGSDANTAHGRLALPEVSAADAVVAPSGPTPLLVFVDKAGKVTFGVGPAWEALATYDPCATTTSRTPVSCCPRHACAT